jgi:hypothetical protein
MIPTVVSSSGGGSFDHYFQHNNIEDTHALLNWSFIPWVLNFPLSNIHIPMEIPLYIPFQNVNLP